LRSDKAWHFVPDYPYTNPGVHWAQKQPASTGEENAHPRVGCRAAF
jgi:hypothetical protein